MQKTFCDRCGTELKIDECSVFIHDYKRSAIGSRHSFQVDLCHKCISEFMKWSQTKNKEDK